MVDPGFPALHRVFARLRSAIGRRRATVLPTVAFFLLRAVTGAAAPTDLDRPADRPVAAHADRPHVVIMQGEDEYGTAETLPRFARDHLGATCRVSFVWRDEASKASFPGIEAVDDADVLFLSVRRTPLPPPQLARIKAHVAAGKPVLGIRTASHAFHLRNRPPPEGLADWPEIDATVFGGSYSNHLSADLATSVRPVAAAAGHPILAGFGMTAFPARGGLYLTAPLAAGTVELLRGKAAGDPREEPVAWTFVREDGGRSFYVAMGHRDDFGRPELPLLLTNAVHWLAEGRTEDRPAAGSGVTAGEAAD
jgi:hypothetical protein